MQAQRSLDQHSEPYHMYMYRRHGLGASSHGAGQHVHTPTTPFLRPSIR